MKVVVFSVAGESLLEFDVQDLAAVTLKELHDFLVRDARAGPAPFRFAHRGRLLLRKSNGGSGSGGSGSLGVAASPDAGDLVPLSELFPDFSGPALNLVVFSAAATSSSSTKHSAAPPSPSPSSERPDPFGAVVTAVSPGSGLASGGLGVTVLGRFPRHDAAAVATLCVRFGSTVVPAYHHHHHGDTALRCVTPEHSPGVVSVEVSTDGINFSSSGLALFTFIEPDTLAHPCKVPADANPPASLVPTAAEVPLRY
jgi:hypothetical protein